MMHAKGTGFSRVLSKIGAGQGKTLIFLMMVQWLFNLSPHMQILLITSSKELRSQYNKDITKFLDDDSNFTVDIASHIDYVYIANYTAVFIDEADACMKSDLICITGN